MSKGDLLMIVHRIPYPPDKGDKIRSFNQLRFLAEQGWRVHLCALADDPDDLRHVDALKRYCASVAVEPLHPKFQKVRSLAAPFRGLPMSASYFYSKKLQQRVDELLQSYPVKAVLCFCSPMAEYLHRSRAQRLLQGEESRVRCVMDLVDIDSDKWQQYARRSSIPMKWLYALEGRLLHRYEQRVAARFDATLLVSSAEACAFRLRTEGEGAIHAVSNGVDIEFFHTASSGESPRPPRISFCGAMSYRPNIDAVSWFARNVLPRIRESLAEVEFWIVGGGAGEEVRALADLPGVQVTGRVEDVRPYVWNSDIAVAPIRIARGIQNKVLEAMALGVPALVTPLAFEGLEAQPGRDLVVAEAVPEAFAVAAIELLLDPARRRQIALSARRVVEGNYSWNGRLQALEELLTAPAKSDSGGCLVGPTASTETQVLFSVIIPARNEERNIGRCLESIAAVDWPAEQIEVLVVDNGSSDATVEIAQGLGAQVLVRPGDTVAGLRNFGVSRSLGQILVFLDADCTVYPDWFRQACRYLDKKDVCCFGSPPVVPAGSTWVQQAWFHVRRKKGCADTEWLESMNMFVRKDAFAEVGGFNTELVTCEDYDLSLRLRRCGRIVSDEGIVAVHHGEAASVGHFFRKEHWRALGNLRGMGSHSFQWRELPSVLLPLIYCLLALVTLAGLLALPFSTGSMLLYALVGLLLVWQLPLYLLAFWKIDPKGLVAASQLYVLMNIYFFARGLASLRCR